MPRYRFAIRRLGGQYDDETGTLLADVAAARDHAERIIRELKESGDYDDSRLTVVVTLPEGSMLHIDIPPVETFIPEDQDRKRARPLKQDRSKLGRDVSITSGRYCEVDARQGAGVAAASRGIGLVAAASEVPLPAPPPGGGP